MGKVTKNMTETYEAVVALGGAAFAAEVQEYLASKGVEKTFNGANATLAALAGKGFVTKAKEPRNEKMYTKYTIAKELPIEAEAKVEAEVEVEVEVAE